MKIRGTAVYVGSFVFMCSKRLHTDHRIYWENSSPGDKRRPFLCVGINGDDLAFLSVTSCQHPKVPRFHIMRSEVVGPPGFSGRDHYLNDVCRPAIGPLSAFEAAAMSSVDNAPSYYPHLTPDEIARVHAAMLANGVPSDPADLWGIIMSGKSIYKAPKCRT